MPRIRYGPHDVQAGFSSAAHARTFPLFDTLLPAEHGRGGNRGPFPSKKAAPIHTPRQTSVVADTNNPYAGLFTGSAMEQAQKIADYLLGPYKDQYNQQLAARHALDATRLKQLQDYIAGIAAQFQGVAPNVLAAYRAASGDQSQIAQGFSGDIRDAVQASADRDNALLSEIGAPSGQMIPGQQATDVGDVTYGLGGWIPATLMSQLGARAFADAAKLPATISARGLSAVSDLVGSQQEADAAAQAAYDQVLAQRPGNVLDLYGQIKDRQATAMEAKQKAKADALKARQDVYDAKVKHAEDLTKASNYLYVVTKGGTVKRATGRNGKPIYVGDLELQTDKASGITTALNPQTGEVVWQRQTQTPAPGAGANYQLKTLPDGTTVVFNPANGKSIKLGNFAKPPNPQAPTIHTFPNGDSIQWDPVAQKWRPLGNFAKPTPPELPSVNYRTVGNNVVAFWFDPKTNEPQQQVVYQGTPDQHLQVVQTGDGGYDIVDLNKGGQVVQSHPAVTQTIGGTGTGGGAQPKLYSSGAAWVPTKDGGWKYVPPPPKPGKPGKRTVLDPDTNLPLSNADIADAQVAIRQLIHPKPGATNPLGSVIAEARRVGIPDEIWMPIVMKQYNIPRRFKDLKYMGVPRLHNLAVFVGALSNDPFAPDRKLNRQELVQWITGHLPKGEAAATAATAETGAARAPGGQYVPLPTPVPPGSEFAAVDAEGAPDASGVPHHAGKDWFAPAGTAVSSPVPGTVIEVKQATSHSGQVFGGVVKVQGANGRVWVFRHVDPAGVKVGDKVKGGQQIATVSQWTDGRTHTHIELWKTLKGGYRYENMIDPLTVFAPGTYPTGSVPAETPAQQSNDAKLATTPGGARRVAKRMALARGWTAKQWRDLNVLIQSESGWNYRAWHNPATGRADVWKGSAPPPHGAFGIGQALGHDLPDDYATNPLTQINWLFQYIADRYQNDPSVALRFKIEHGGLHGGWY